MIDFISNKFRDYEINNNCVSIYRSKKKQVLLNIPIVNPLLIIILSGNKIVGDRHKSICSSGEFIFFPCIQSMNMRNIPKESNYLALLIEFEISDFLRLAAPSENKNEFIIGKVNHDFEQCIKQFVDCLEWAPTEIVKMRRIEILNFLMIQGYSNLSPFLNIKRTAHKVIEILNNAGNKSITTQEICKKIYMSQSTLYRKLRNENENIQNLKDKVLMGKAMHLLQTTNLSSLEISELVGYSSHNRFIQKFTSYFGLTPNQLKNTRT